MKRKGVVHSSLSNFLLANRKLYVRLISGTKNCSLPLVLLTLYVNDIGYRYGKSYFIVSFA